MANGIRRSRGSQREGEGNLQEGGGETQEVSESSRGSSTEGRDGSKLNYTYKALPLRGGTVPNKEGASGSLLYLSTDPDSVCKTLGKLFKLSEPHSPKLKMRITFVSVVVCSTNI